MLLISSIMTTLTIYVSTAAADGASCESLFNSSRKVVYDIPNFTIVDTRGKEVPLAIFNALSNGQAAPIVTKRLYATGPIEQLLASQTLDFQGRIADRRIEAIAPFLKKMVTLGETRFVVHPTTLEKLDHLYKVMPNFAKALDEVKKSLAISIASGEPIRIQPIILTGDPGLGKTHFAEDLAAVLGLNSDVVSMNNVTGSWVLSGNNPTWNGASPGKVARLLIEGQFANPFMIIDEVDKANSMNGDAAISPLYNLLERRTAKKFVDEFIDQPIDASLINWILTANDLSRIPDAILKRTRVIHVKKPTLEQMRAVVPNVMKGVLAQYPQLKFSDRINEDVFMVLANHVPREIRKLLDSAVGSAVIDKRQQILLKDIDLSLLEEETTKNRIGF